MWRLARRELVIGFEYDASKEIHFCELCTRGKHHRSSFLNDGGERSNDLLGVVHSDVCGKINAKSLNGAESFVTFIDDKFQYIWVYVKHKSLLFEKFLK